ncbi:MAG TPA: sulfite exporter TauE/SafE family protein [Alphaproteobacteria bacterium]
MPDPGTALYASFCLFLGGLLKGVVGLGLPLVALPLLALKLPLAACVTTLIIPIFATNLTQTFQRGLFAATVRRFWPTLLVLIVCIIVSTNGLVLIREDVLYAIIGASLLTLTAATRLQPKLHVPPAQERWVGPVAGAVSGVLGGISSVYGPPLMLFLAALRLPKHEFVATISLFFLAGHLALSVGVASFGIASFGDFMLSAAAVIPTLAGLWLGQRVQVRLDERRFRLTLDAVYVATGASFLLRALA